MIKTISLLAILLLASSAASLAQCAADPSTKPKDAAPAKPGVLSKSDLPRVVPASFFYAGQVAPVQMRNAAAARLANGKLIVAALVDNSGYSSNVAEKYQGLLIAESDLLIGGKTLGAGAYGIGVTSDGQFNVMDIGGHGLLKVPAATDGDLKHPVPLKLEATHPSANQYRLYLGARYVQVNGATTE